MGGITNQGNKLQAACLCDVHAPRKKGPADHASFELVTLNCRAEEVSREAHERSSGSGATGSAAQELSSRVFRIWRQNGYRPS